MRMNAHRLIFCLAFSLVLIFGSSSHAELLQTQEWEEWNAAARPFFPDESWKQYATPEEAGWSSEKLASARLASDLAGSEAMMLIYNGAVLEQWGQVERVLACYSMSKSLMSALYGIAAVAGNVDIDETIGSIGIDDDRGLTALEKSAKVADLLKSRSGIYLPAAFRTFQSTKTPKRGSHEPGTHWYYNNWGFNALGTIYNRKTSGDLFEDFESEIAEPLQMQDFDLKHTSYRYEAIYSRHPSSQFLLSARDLARFGLLFLNDGWWKDKDIVPAQWVRESTQAYTELSDSGYGYMWWTTTGELGDLGAYAASGNGGNFVFVVPGARLVLVNRGVAYQTKTVDWTTVQAFLKEVLKARVGPPKKNPELVDLPESQVDEIIVEASPRKIALKLNGHVQSPYKKADTHCASHGKKGTIGQVDRLNNIYEFLCY